MSKTVTKPLGDILQFQRGYDLPSTKRVDGSYPVISSAGFSGTHSSYKVEGENVVTGRYGTIGEIYYYNGKCWPLNTALYVKDFKGNVPKYVYYLLQYSLKVDGKDKSTVPGVDRNVLHTLNIPYFSDIDYQKAVIKPLVAIDEKIELNKRINSELEAMAKALYDYWFVQFDFPDENGKPYRTSGGAMEWNEQLKREIPKGWYVGKLKDIITIAGEPTSPGEHLKGMFYTPIDELPKKSMSFYGGLPYTDANSSLQLYDKNDLLLGAMRVYFHRVCIAAQNGITRSTTIVLRPKNEQHLPFAFETLNTDSTIQYATKVSVGTQQPYVNWDGALDSHLIVLPPDNQVIDSYSEIIYPIINIVQKNVRENYELTHLRDWLLPMLMNGQATVSDETNCDRVANFAEIPKTDDERFSLWLQNQGIAARGELDRKTLREIFNAMDDDDK